MAQLSSTSSSFYSEYATVTEALRRALTEKPRQTAFVFLEDGEYESVRLTREAVDRSARAVAAALQREGATTGDRVLLLHPSGPAFVAAFLGCLYAGVTPAPCEVPSRNRRSPRLASISEHVGARWVLSGTQARSAFERAVDAYPRLSDATWLLPADIALDRADEWQPPDIARDALALLQYTSGSTSDPRGVMVSHGNLLANLDDMNAGWDHPPESVMVTWLPVFHDMGLIYALLQPLVGGFQCVMMPPAAFLQSPVRWLRAIGKYRGTHSAAPNFAYDLCVERIAVEQRRNLDLSSWRIALNAAEPVRAVTLERFAHAFAECGFDPRTFTPGFGLAEATIKVSTCTASQPLSVLQLNPGRLAQHEVARSWSEDAVAIVGCGTPVHGTVVRIVDPETRIESPSGKIGEIWVSGRVVAQGYWRDPAATEEVFAAQMAGSHAGPFLRTGDLGFLHAGELFITGRRKDLIIVHGRNYYPQDIERTVETCHPALALTGVGAFGIEVGGAESVAVVCEVRRTELRRLVSAEVLWAARRAVAEEHGLPLETIVLLKPKSLPKTSSGKVRRAACRSAFMSGTLHAIAEWRAGQSGEGATSRSEAEIRRWLVDRFAARTGIDTAAMDTRASFANYGIQSVDAVALATELEEWLGVPVQPTLVFDYPTIDAVARKLGGTDPTQAPKRRAASMPIAVVGLACRFPGARNAGEFWQLLRDGVDAVRPTPPDRQAVPRGAFGGFIEGVDLFDADFFAISPREAERIDPQQRVMLELAWEALEDAGIPPERLGGTPTGVFIGVSNSDYGRMLAATVPGDIYLGTATALSIVANRISYTLDLRGPSLAVDTACSSSLVALALALRSLRMGECDTALAGGVNLILGPEYTAAFTNAKMLSPDGRCKAFDAAANGYVRGEGGGIVVLRRLEDAETEGDRILAVVRGVGMSQDGRSSGLTAPNGPAQSAVIREALLDAGLSPARVSYVEAHGTGTALGDPIEVQALNTVLFEDRDPDSVCRVGSVKSNIGHLESAAGIAGLIKVVLSLQHRVIPATLHVRQVNPRLSIGKGPVRIATSCEQWKASDETRVAGVSSFGFGGTNAHTIVEEYRVPERLPAAWSDREDHVLTLSARDPHALREAAESYAAYLASDPEVAFSDVCFTSNVGRSQMRHRLAVTARTAAEARGALRTAAAVQAAVAPSDKIVFVYTGNGAEYSDMCIGLYETEPVFRDSIDQCSTILGMSLSGVLAVQDLRVSQPAIFALEYALTQLWAAWGVAPSAVIGHSLGEYTAACVAGALPLPDALRLTAARGRLLEALSSDAAMVAVRASREVVEKAIAPWSRDLDIAAVNGPGQVVFSGTKAAAEQATAELTRQGVRWTMLPLARAFHSPAMHPILVELRGEAARVKSSKPRIPLISCLTGDWKRDAPDSDYWPRHMREPVLFGEGIKKLRAAGHRQFLEIGPHPILSALGEQFFSDDGSIWLSSLHREERPHQRMLASLSKLWMRGVEVDWTLIDRGRGRRKISLPTYAFQRKRHWIESSSVTVEHYSLPGRRIELAGSEAVVYEGRVRGGTLTVDGIREMVGAAIPSRDGRGDWSIHVDSGQPPQWGETEEQCIQTVLKPYDEGWAWQVFSRAVSDHDGAWTLHAEGRARGGGIGQQRDLLTLRWIHQPYSRPANARLRPGTWVVFSDSCGVGAHIADILRTHGACVTLIDDDQPGDQRNVLAGAAGVVHLWSLNAQQSLSSEAFRAAIERGPASVLLVLQTMVECRSNARLWLVTRGAQSISAPISDGGLLQSPLWGIGKTIALEHPEHWGGMVDVDKESVEAAAAQVVDELLAHDVRNGEDHVAYRAGKRLVARVDRAPSPPLSPVVIRSDATYLISGGLGDLGLALAASLNQAGARHLILLSRQGASTESRRAAVRRLVTAGVSVRVIAVDVRDRSALERELENTARGMPPIRGVVHAAGLPGYTPMGAMTSENLDNVLGAKAEGALALRAATIGANLDFFACISSLVATWGSAKQAHYVAGNHFLDQFASREGITTIGLGPLLGGMLPDSAVSGLRQIGLTLWSMQQAAEAVLDAIRANQRHVVDAGIDWSRYGGVLQARGRRAILERVAAVAVKTTVAEGALAKRLRNAPRAKRERMLMNEIVGEASRVLGMNPNQWPDLHRGLFDLGMDSLTALELKNRLEAALGQPLPSTLVFDHPSIAALSTFIGQNVLSWGEEAPQPKSIAAAAGSESAREDLEATLVSKLEELERVVGRI